jgi:SAM-dependent methyltransferase
MTWEYLETEQFDFRLKIIAAYLKEKTQDKIIVDLDCGTARLVKFLEDDYLLYYGNDICISSIRKAQIEAYNKQKAKCLFETLEDENVFSRLKNFKGIDILLSLGHGAGEFINPQIESPTLTNVFRSIVMSYAPQFAVLEMIQEWEKKFDLISSFKKFMFENAYIVDYDVFLKIIPDDFVGERRILFFKKRCN